MQKKSYYFKIRLEDKVNETLLRTWKDYQIKDREFIDYIIGLNNSNEFYVYCAKGARPSKFKKINRSAIIEGKRRAEIILPRHNEEDLLIFGTNPSGFTYTIERKCFEEGNTLGSRYQHSEICPPDQKSEIKKENEENFAEKPIDRSAPTDCFARLLFPTREPTDTSFLINNPLEVLKKDKYSLQGKLDELGNLEEQIIREENLLKDLEQKKEILFREKRLAREALERLEYQKEDVEFERELFERQAEHTKFVIEQKETEMESLMKESPKEILTDDKGFEELKQHRQKLSEQRELLEDTLKTIEGFICMKKEEKEEIAAMALEMEHDKAHFEATESHLKYNILGIPEIISSMRERLMILEEQQERVRHEFNSILGENTTKMQAREMYTNRSCAIQKQKSTFSHLILNIDKQIAISSEISSIEKGITYLEDQKKNISQQLHQNAIKLNQLIKKIAFYEKPMSELTAHKIQLNKDKIKIDKEIGDCDNSIQEIITATAKYQERQLIKSQQEIRELQAQWINLNQNTKRLTERAEKLAKDITEQQKLVEEMRAQNYILKSKQIQEVQHRKNIRTLLFSKEIMPSFFSSKMKNVKGYLEDTSLLIDKTSLTPTRKDHPHREDLVIYEEAGLKEEHYSEESKIRKTRDNEGKKEFSEDQNVIAISKDLIDCRKRHEEERMKHELPSDFNPAHPSNLSTSLNEFPKSYVKAGTITDPTGVELINNSLAGYSYNRSKKCWIRKKNWVYALKVNRATAVREEPCSYDIKVVVTEAHEWMDFNHEMSDSTLSGSVLGILAGGATESEGYSSRATGRLITRRLEHNSFIEKIRISFGDGVKQYSLLVLFDFFDRHGISILSILMFREEYGDYIPSSYYLGGVFQIYNSNETEIRSFGSYSNYGEGMGGSLGFGKFFSSASHKYDEILKSHSSHYSHKDNLNIRIYGGSSANPSTWKNSLNDPNGLRVVRIDNRKSYFYLFYDLLYWEKIGDTLDESKKEGIYHEMRNQLKQEYDKLIELSRSKSMEQLFDLLYFHDCRDYDRIYLLRENFKDFQSLHHSEFEEANPKSKALLVWIKPGTGRELVIGGKIMIIDWKGERREMIFPERKEDIDSSHHLIYVGASNPHFKGATLSTCPPYQKKRVDVTTDMYRCCVSSLTREKWLFKQKDTNKFEIIWDTSDVLDVDSSKDYLLTLYKNTGRKRDNASYWVTLRERVARSGDGDCYQLWGWSKNRLFSIQHHSTPLYLIPADKFSDPFGQDQMGFVAGHLKDHTATWLLDYPSVNLTIFDNQTGIRNCLFITHEGKIFFTDNETPHLRGNMASWNIVYDAKFDFQLILNAPLNYYHGYQLAISPEALKNPKNPKQQHYDIILVSPKDTTKYIWHYDVNQIRIGARSMPGDKKMSRVQRGNLYHLCATHIGTNHNLGWEVNYGSPTVQYIPKEDKKLDEVMDIEEEQTEIVGAVIEGHPVKWSSKFGGPEIAPHYKLNQQEYPQAWPAATNNQAQFIEVCATAEKSWTGVEIQGRGDCDQWVTKFIVEYAKDFGRGEYQVVDGGAIFEGSKDRNTTVKVNFKQKVIGTNLRIRPKEWNKHISMRFEAYYRTRKIPTFRSQNISAISRDYTVSFSSCHENHVNWRLNSQTVPQCWAQGKSDKNPIIEIDAKETKAWTGVILQGRGDADQWVTAFEIEYYSEDDGGWKSANNQGKLFRGAFDRNTENPVVFQEPLRGSIIRIRPRACKGYMSLRFDALHAPEEDDHSYGDIVMKKVKK